MTSTSPSQCGAAAAAGIGVVVPCFNADPMLDRCLGALRAHAGPELPIVVVDDASTEGNPAAVARRHGARIVTLDDNGGPAVARNAGVAEIDEPLVLFVDADVLVHEDTVRLAAETLEEDARLGACFGSYDEHPADPGFLSQFRNLYHRWVHQNGNTDASTFWTGCGAVRRAAFDAAGGFSEVLSHLGMEDIDLGYRMRDAGFRIRLVKSMTCTHLKAWRLGSMIRTDIFHRGVPWMLLILARDGAPDDLNLDAKSRWCTLLGGVLPGAVVAGFAWPALWIAAAAAGTGIALLQRKFLGYVGALRGTRFALAAVPALWLLYVCAAASVPIALWRHATGRGLAGRLASPPRKPDSPA